MGGTVGITASSVKAAMDLLLVTVLLGCWLSASSGLPRNTNMSKELYRRQTLPEIPGYIPVYIQHGDEPPVWKSSPIKHKTRVRPGQHRDRLQPNLVHKPHSEHLAYVHKRQQHDSMRTQPSKRVSHRSRFTRRRQRRVA